MLVWVAREAGAEADTDADVVTVTDADAVTGTAAVTVTDAVTATDAVAGTGLDGAEVLTDRARCAELPDGAGLALLH
jgi:hypothetical protein